VVVVVGHPEVTDAGNGGPWEWRPLGMAALNPQAYLWVAFCDKLSCKSSDTETVDVFCFPIPKLPIMAENPILH